MEDTESFHKICAPVNVQAKEIHFAAAIGVTQFTRQVRVFDVYYKQLKSSFRNRPSEGPVMETLSGKAELYSQLLQSEPDNNYAPIDSALWTFWSKDKFYAVYDVIDVTSLDLTFAASVGDAY